MCAATQLNVFPSYPVYKPLRNKAFDRYIYAVRSRFGAKPVRNKDLMKVAPKLEGLAGIGLLADQSPFKKNKGKIWSYFMGKETAFYKGVMVLPYLTQFPCFFAEVYRLKKGYYEVKFHEMSPPPYDKKDLKILKEYIDLSEKAIKNHPEDWLWTHKRWKYKRKDTEEIIIFQS
jgi:KDO2-lipid IV(A) lauroyltransferase